MLEIVTMIISLCSIPVMLYILIPMMIVLTLYINDMIR